MSEPAVLIAGTPELAAAIVPLLSDLDRDELDALTDGDSVAFIAERASASSRCWSMLFYGRPLFFAGITIDGVAWMLGTPEIARAKRSYVRAMRLMVEDMQIISPVIRAWVDVRYHRSLRLMERLGFELGEPIYFAGRMVCPAERRAAK